MPVLTLIDTLGIQSFVFASNRLKDVAGGSWLVDQATSKEGWIKRLVPPDNIIVGAGGNLLIKFVDSDVAKGLDVAKEFATRLSREVLDKAPGLEVAIAHQEYQEGQFVQAVRNIQVVIEKQKLERRPSVPLLGLGVTAACRETRLPAVGTDEGVPIAAGVALRRQDSDKHQDRWLKFLPSDYQSFQRGQGGVVELAFPLELDHLGRSSGDTSLMGVVHMDGNGIGQKLKTWLEEHAAKGTADATVEQEYRSWSVALDQLAEGAFRSLVNRVVAAIRWEERNGYVLHCATLNQSFALRCEKDRQSGRFLLYLPVRPILLGGDDLTFVCDGRIALDLSAAALGEFEQTSIPHLGAVRACAGVALVKTHTPFARAYDLAESLCTSAKQMLREKNLAESALDWHIGFSSPTETLSGLRKRQYVSETNELTCRPYLLGKSEQSPSWRWLAEEVLGTRGNGFHTDDPKNGANWSAHRSKLKALREIVREGRSEVEKALNAWTVAHPLLALPAGMPNGFTGSRTPLLDAIELLDIHFPL